MAEKSIMHKIIDSFIEEFSKDPSIGKPLGESLRKIISEDDLKKDYIMLVLREGDSDEDTPT